jgi:hypothetical protein
LDWKIFYGDKSTFSSDDGDPFHAPTNNVQVVNNNGKLQSGKTAYYWNFETGWNGCDTPGLWDYLLMYHGPKAVLFGRSIRDEDYWKVRKKAKAEIEASHH